MGYREPCHNRHTVSRLTDYVVVSPKVSRTRKRYVQALYLRVGFGDYRGGIYTRTGFQMCGEFNLH